MPFAASVPTGRTPCNSSMSPTGTSGSRGWSTGNRPGAILLCDRYLASSVAYGEAQGLNAAWLVEIQRYLPQPDVTILLDISPDESARRKSAGRDKYERDLALLTRVRDSYLRQATGSWARIAADRDRDTVAAEVFAAVAKRL